MSTPRSPGETSVGTVGCLEPDSGLIPVTRPLPLAGPLVRFRTNSGHLRQPVTRRKREMIPADKKDATYWIKREKNNVAARLSREKRRLKDLMVEGHLLTLSKENAHLRAQVLTLQYNRSLCVDTGKVTYAQEDATSPAGVLPPSLSLPPVHGHRPALLQPGLWGNNAACFGGVTQQSAMHQIETPCFSPARYMGVFNPILQGLSGPSVVSASEDRVGCSRSAEARMDVHRLSSREDTCLPTAAPAQLLSPIPAFLCTPGSLRPVSALHCPSHHRLLPQSRYSAANRPCDLRLRSSYLPPPAVYPGLPLQPLETQHQGLCLDAHMGMEVQNRFSGAQGRISHVGLHLSPGGR